MDTQQPEKSGLARYKLLSKWFDERGKLLFENKGQLGWLVRQHRQELVEADALLPRDGRYGSLVDQEKFEQAVIGIWKRKALEKIGQAA